ncbi:hypothetical protein IAR50_006940 [Cryptococcus sp. DSM 104548]
MTSPIDPRALLDSFPGLLPSGTSSPLPHPTDAVAALVHTIHTALGFRLVPSQAFHEEPQSRPNDPQGEDIDDNQSEITAVDPADDTAPPPNALGQPWNARAEDSYSFEYRHAQSAMVFRARVGRMGNRVQVDAMAEDGEPHNLSIVLAELIQPSSFPIPSAATASSADSSDGVDAAAKKLGFKSLNDVKAFIEKYNREVISKLLPGLDIPGYTQATSSSSRQPPAPSNSSTPAPARPHPYPSLLDDPPSRSINPASVGHRDLDPLADLRPGAGGFNPGSDGGGMLVDFNHPLFAGRGGQGRGLGGDDLTGPGGSVQPPGARWDPVGPGSGGIGPRPTPGGRFGVGGAGGGFGGGRSDRWGDELAPPGEYGPDLGQLGGPRGSGNGGFGGLGGGLGARGGRGGGGGFGGLGGGSGFGGGMYM